MIPKHTLRCYVYHKSYGGELIDIRELIYSLFTLASVLFDVPMLTELADFLAQQDIEREQEIFRLMRICYGNNINKFRKQLVDQLKRNVDSLQNLKGNYYYYTKIYKNY